MKKNLKNSLKEFNNFFGKEPTANTQSWSLLHDFYHLLLTYMEKSNISYTKLAKKLDVSRSAISQLFNEQPNISLKRISQVSNSIGLKLRLTSDQIDDSLDGSKAQLNATNKSSLGKGNKSEAALFSLNKVVKVSISTINKRANHFIPEYIDDRRN